MAYDVGRIVDVMLLFALLVTELGRLLFPATPGWCRTGLRSINMARQMNIKASNMTFRHISFLIAAFISAGMSFGQESPVASILKPVSDPDGECRF